MDRIEFCARHAHEVNRSYCSALGDDSQPLWNDAPEWQRESAREGVRALYDDPTRTPEQSHEGWLEHKRRTGWTWGPVKDGAAKTHPCMVPYADLPREQRAKDHIFRAAVLGMIWTLTGFSDDEIGRAASRKEIRRRFDSPAAGSFLRDETARRSDT